MIIECLKKNQKCEYGYKYMYKFYLKLTLYYIYSSLRMKVESFGTTNIMRVIRKNSVVIVK